MATHSHDRHAIWRIAMALAIGTGLAGTLSPARARPPSAPMDAQDMRIVARALGFARPARPGDSWVAIVFAPGSAASRADADRLAALFGDGLRSGEAMLRARPVSADALAATEGYAALLMAAGAPTDAAMAAAHARRVVCVTNEIADVEAGRCALWVRSEPRIEVVVSRASLQVSGVGFAAAFRMMIREL